MMDTSTSEVEVKSKSTPDKPTSTDPKTIVVLHTKDQRRAADQHVEYLQRKGHYAVRKQCNDIKSFKDMNISPYSRLDMLVDLRMFSMLMKEKQLHEDAAYKYEEIDDSEKELYSINMFGSDFSQLLKNIPPNINEEAHHASDYPKMLPITNNTGMGGGTANGATAVGAVDGKTIIMINVNDWNGSYDVKKVENKSEITHKGPVNSGGNENSSEPELDLRFKVPKEKQEKVSSKIEEQKDKLKEVNGVSGVETSEGSIIITFTLEKGHDVTVEWIKGILPILFDDILKSSISEGEIFRVDVQRRVQYERKHVSDEEFGKRIRVLEIAAQKTSLAQTLHVDGDTYRRMTKSLLDPSPKTASQATDNIQSTNNYKQSKMTESITDDAKRHGADKDDKRALPTKDETYLAMPAAPMKNKTTAWGPKREPLWTDDEIVRLRQFFFEPRKDNEGKAICLKILVLGPIGHGKSSLCNGFRSAIMRDNRPSNYHAVGGISTSLTRGFLGAIYGDHSIIDMDGIYELKNISSMNTDIASGRVPFYAELTDTLGVYDKERIAFPSPGENDGFCVVIVLKYDKELGPELKRQIGVILDLEKQGVLSYRLVLTCLDECDPQFGNTDNLPLMYQSDKVQSAVQRMSEETGIPAYAIHFVKNYTREAETDNNTTLQHLRVLEGVIFSAYQQVEKKSDQKRKRVFIELVT